MKVFLTEQVSEETPVDTCHSGTGVKETYLGRVWTDVLDFIQMQ